MSSKYTKYQNLAPVTRRWNVHPIWQGIGCILIILIPLMSFAAATLLIEANKTQNYFPVSPELNQPVDLTKVLKYMPGLDGVVRWTEQFSKIELMVTAGIVIVGFALLSFLYSIIYNMLGPSRYSPLDVPDIKRRGKKQKLR
jgi:hypothetical protein